MGDTMEWSRDLIFPTCMLIVTVYVTFLECIVNTKPQKPFSSRMDVVVVAFQLVHRVSGGSVQIYLVKQRVERIIIVKLGVANEPIHQASDIFLLGL